MERRKKIEVKLFIARTNEDKQTHRKESYRLKMRTKKAARRDKRS